MGVAYQNLSHVAKKECEEKARAKSEYQNLLKVMVKCSNRKVGKQPLIASRVPLGRKRKYDADIEPVVRVTVKYNNSEMGKPLVAKLIWEKETNQERQDEGAANLVGNTPNKDKETLKAKSSKKVEQFSDKIGSQSMESMQEKVAPPTDANPPNEKMEPPKKEPPSPLRLCVMLRPLTPLLPPIQKDADKGGGNKEEQLGRPPLFSVVIFPSQNPPFLVPFAWAYGLSLALSKGDRVSLPFDNTLYTGSIIGVKLLGEVGLHRLFPDLFVCEEPGSSSLSSIRDRLGQLLRSYAALKYHTVRPIPMEDLRAVVWMIYCHCQTTLSREGRGNVVPSCLLAPQSRERNRPPPHLSSTHLIDYIRSSFPLWDGVRVQWDDGSECDVNVWELTKVNDSNRLAQPSNDRFNGLVYTMDDPLRAKIEMVLQAFIKKTPEATSLVPPVTDDIAPGYGCVVPMGMSFRRIFKRLKRHPLKSSNSQQESNVRVSVDQAARDQFCYYRSVASVLSDLSDIYYNCVLFNGSSSAIAQSVLDITNTGKDLIQEIKSRYTREQKLKEKQLQDHPTLLLHPDAMLLRRSNIPFKGNLQRGWAQAALPDESWDKSPSRTASTFCDSPCLKGGDKDKPHDKSYWVPQAGDKILYSRCLHKEWIKGHSLSLTSDQIALPLILPPASDHIGKSNRTGVNEEVVDSDFKYWMVGTVLWVRATFPSEYTGSATFEELSPLFTMGIQFHYTWASRNIHLVHWRPCCIKDHSNSTQTVHKEDHACDGDNTVTKELNDFDDGTSSIPPCDYGTMNTALTPASDEPLAITKTPESNCCLSCGLDIFRSFLQPAWMASKSNEDSILTTTPAEYTLCVRPSGLLSERCKYIDECLDILKARVVEEIPPDTVGRKPQTRRVAHQHIVDMCVSPEISFEDMLNDIDICEDQVETRHGGDKAVHRVRNTLARMHFLPPWLYSGANEQMGKKDMNPKNNCKQQRRRQRKHETLMPLPNLCLELVHRRLRNGYYRTLTGALCDLREACVSSILYILIAQRSKPLKDIVLLIQEKQGEIVRPDGQHSLSGMTCSSHNNSTNKKHQWSKNDQSLAARVKLVRNLYATAMVCFSETPCALTAFGKKKFQSQKKKAGLAEVIQDQKRAVARRNVELLLNALSYDPCNIRRPLGSNHPYPTLRIRVSLHETGDVLAPTIDEDKIEGKPRGVCTAETNSATGIRGMLKDGAEKENKHKINITGTSEIEQHGKNKQVEEGKVFSCSVEDSESEDEVRSFIDMSQPIIFEQQDYENDSDLVRTFFNLGPNRVNACARCKLSKRSLLICRVRKAHSNVDFDLTECVDKFGGIDGLCRILDPSLPIQNIETPSFGPVQSDSIAPISTPAHTTVKSNELSSDKDSKYPTQKRKTTPDVTSKTDMTKADLVALQQPSHSIPSDGRFSASVDKDRIERGQDHPTAKGGVNVIGQGIADKQSSSVPMPSTEVVVDGGSSALTILEKADSAVRMAQKALAKARSDIIVRPQLAKEFVKHCFPVDTDDQFFYCSKCGLGGDLLCCENCPMVAHIECVGLSNVPESDWVCGDCNYFVDRDRQGQDSQDAPVPDQGVVSSEEGISLSQLLEELRSLRVKSKPENVSKGMSNKSLNDTIQQTVETDIKQSTRQVGSCDGTALYETNENKEGDDNEKGNDFIRSLRVKSKPEDASKGMSNKSLHDTIRQIVETDIKQSTRQFESCGGKGLYETNENKEGDDNEKGNYFKETAKSDTKEGSGQGQESEDEALPETRENKEEKGNKKSSYVVGTKMIKTFEAGDFEGTVIDIPSEEIPFYKVQYGDGDEEEFSEDELQSHIQQFKSNRIAVKVKESTKFKNRGQPSPEEVSEVTTRQQCTTAKRRGRPRKKKCPDTGVIELRVNNRRRSSSRNVNLRNDQKLKKR